MKLLPLLLICLCWIVGCSESQRNYYNNINEVKLDGAINRGWIPGILPASSFNIQETHNLDTNEGNGSFQFLESDESSFKKSLGEEIKAINKENLANGSVYRWKNFIISVDWSNNKALFILD